MDDLLVAFVVLTGLLSIHSPASLCPRVSHCMTSLCDVSERVAFGRPEI